MVDTNRFDGTKLKSNVYRIPQDVLMEFQAKIEDATEIAVDSIDFRDNKYYFLNEDRSVIAMAKFDPEKDDYVIKYSSYAMEAMRQLGRKYAFQRGKSLGIRIISGLAIAGVIFGTGYKMGKNSKDIDVKDSKESTSYSETLEEESTQRKFDKKGELDKFDPESLEDIMNWALWVGSELNGLEDSAEFPGQIAIYEDVRETLNKLYAYDFELREAQENGMDLVLFPPAERQAKLQGLVSDIFEKLDKYGLSKLGIAAYLDETTIKNMSIKN